jgi:hypothetical protein
MKIGFDDVDIHHKLSNGKKPDVFFKIKDQEVCLELTTLNSRESETKIERILTYLADFVVQKCNRKNYTMLIYFDTINDTQQESRIKDLIKLEPKITLKQDKLELLSEIDIFLKRSSIDTDFLRQLKPIIQKNCDDKDP